MEEKKKSHKIIWFVVCFILLALIFAIILPAFRKAKDSGLGYVRTKCMANTRTIALTCIIYQDEECLWPEKAQWCDLTTPYENDYQCPTDNIGPCSYAMNENIPADANELPGDLVLLFESAPGWNTIGGSDDVVTDRHGGPGANIAFADGHVEFVEAEEIPNLRWTVENKSTER